MAEALERPDALVVQRLRVATRRRGGSRRRPACPAGRAHLLLITAGHKEVPALGEPGDLLPLGKDGNAFVLLRGRDLEVGKAATSGSSLGALTGPLG